MNKEIISFKGTSDGLTLNIRGSDIELIKSQLDKKVQKSLEFYKGMRFLGVTAKDLSEDEVLDLTLLLKYKYDMDISLEEIASRASKGWPKEEDERKTIESRNFYKEYPTKFVYGTLRSGQEVDYNGNIVIMGDVNPGGLLKAGANIIVLGSLKGIAHAGLNGDTDSIVSAYSLQPTQLRIADIIVRAPDGDNWESKLPEIARINSGEIVIEPYLPNK